MLKIILIGILYVKEDQLTENEWFGNQHGLKNVSFFINLCLFNFYIYFKGSYAFNKFLSIIGTKITLKDWPHFRGGLDVNGFFLISISTYFIQYLPISFNFYIFYSIST